MKKWNAWLSLLLAVALIFGQSGAVYAAEAIAETVNEENNNETTESEVDENDSVVSDEGTNDAVKNEDENPAEIVDEVNKDSGIPTEDEDSTETENKEDETQPSEGDQEEFPEEPSNGDDILDEEQNKAPDDSAESGETENNLVDDLQNSGLSVEKRNELNSLGFKTMSLNQAMMQDKKELAEVVTEFASMKPGEDYVENEIVVFADTEEQALEIAECYGGTLTEYEYGVARVSVDSDVTKAVEVAADMEISIPAVYPNIINRASSIADIPEDKISERESSVTEEDELVWFGEQPYALSPSDPYYGNQWYMDEIGVTEAWEETKGSGIVVAVLDSGVDYDHPDLKDNIVAHTSTYGNGLDDGKDDNGHGTHCAGIIAAAKNDIGIVGVAPEAKIYSIKVLGENGSGDIVDTIQGVVKATEANVDVISMSLGAWLHIPVFQEKIDEAVNKGIVVMAAAGNDGVSQKMYPAAYNNVIAVAATSEDYATGSGNALTYFSNYGSWVDIAAPGEDIYSTLPTYPSYITSDPDYPKATGYDSLDGTSMACPVVAGTVALMLSANSALKNDNSKASVDKITNTLLKSATIQSYEGCNSWYDQYEDLHSEFYGKSYPFVDVESAVYEAVGNVPDKPEPPTIKFFEYNWQTGTKTEITPDNKNVVSSGENKYFSLESSTPHAKIYYTINGAKPTAKTGNRYYADYDDGIWMERSGKVKIQAVSVIGNKVSKVFSQTYKFEAKATGLYPSTSEMDVIIGKSIQLTANIEPSYASSKKLKWSVVEGGSPNITVNAKNGKVTCKKGATAGETAIIKAETTDKSDQSCQFNIKVINADSTGIQLKDIEKVSNKYTLNMSWYASSNGITVNNIKYLNDVQLKPVDDNGNAIPCLYKTSNPKVAYVDEDGWVEALQKGSAKITVTANDGSGRKLTCNVKVVTPVWDIYTYSSTGYSGNSEFIPIATGCSISMKTIINGNSKEPIDVPSNKGVKWTQESAGSSPITISSSGKVTCRADESSIGKSFTYVAEAKDGWGTKTKVTFLVTNKIEKICYLDKGQQLTSVNFINPIQVGGGFYDLDVISIYTKYDPEKGLNKYVWTEFAATSSNKDVAYHYFDSDNKEWVTVATKKGSTTLTYTTRDGSNKKFKAKIKVVDNDTFKLEN